MQRGWEARCTACGARRPPLGHGNVTLAGAPSRLGGAAATYAGWSVLAVGSSLSLGAGLLLQSIWPASLVGWAVAVPLAVMTWFFGLSLVLGGRRLRQRGAARLREAQLAAARAYVAHHRGVVTAAGLAANTELTAPEADALLAQVAAEASHPVSIEVDPDGKLRYDFDADERRWRVLDEQFGDELGVADEVADERAAGRAKTRS